MTLHPAQQEVVKSKARFKVVRAGRRSGKTILKIETMLFKAVSRKDQNIFYIAPTQKQARSIIWESLKTRLGKIGQPNESRLEMRIPTQDGGFSTVFIAGWENRENFRGMKAHHIEFDEVDTMKDFFIGWQEIFRPALIDTNGTVGFGGTPKKENPNLRRLEKGAKEDNDFACFRFTTFDNPFVEELEIERTRKELDSDTFKQEILAEYIDNLGALFHYDALIDLFSNTVVKDNQKYLTVDIADDGSDQTIFAFWDSRELYRLEEFEGLNTENIISNIREYASNERIPHSHIAVDAIGVGAGVASSSLLDGIVGYKSSYGAIKTDKDIVRLPNVHYTKDAPLVSEYYNLRSQCVFFLARLINGHDLACSVKSVRIKERIIEELSQYQDVSKGDGKRRATGKDEIKILLGHSPDLTDTMIMRMYFEIKNVMLPDQSQLGLELKEAVERQFAGGEYRQHLNSTK